MPHFLLLRNQQSYPVNIKISNYKKVTNNTVVQFNNTVVQFIISNVQFVWSPVHVGIPDNGKADKGAKGAVNGNSTNVFFHTSMYQSLR